MVRGELDWIVRKTLEKDRARRYETANELAADIQRYLSNEPVLACPPSAVYRLKKFARRNRGLLTTVVLVSASLVIGLAVSLWQASEARDARRLADERRLAEQEARSEADEQREQAEVNFAIAMEALDEIYLKAMGEEVVGIGDVNSYVATRYMKEGKPELTERDRELLERGLVFYDRFAQQNRDKPEAVFETGKALCRVGFIQFRLGEHEEAGKSFVRAVARLKPLTEEYPNEPEYFLELGRAYYRQTKLSG